ncbi:MAG: class I SAM-dependent methyltransferase [Lachnospiraceae bacterium]|nr:class I SAM-dependent methyltransferase [Lachnospiraceae bacterium]
MDLNETKGVIFNRHPWELSRTKSFIKIIKPYLTNMHKEKAKLKYINIGAGDLYFDQVLGEQFPNDEVHAVDIAYAEIGKDGNVTKYHYLSQVNEMFDYAIMMDSLEYIEDDAAFLNQMVSKTIDGGYFFFTLPAYPFLFSGYDILIKNLRRYSRKTFRETIAKVPGLEIVKTYHFYTLLFVLRVWEKIKKQKYDPEEYLTASWKYQEKGFVTQFLKTCLNVDFAINKFLSKIGIRLPGLSLLAICSVKNNSTS